jgi:hypothetical protein
MLVKVFFWLLFDKNFRCVCPLQGASWDSISKFSKGEYHHGWCKAMDILKQVEHMLFSDTKIQQGNNNEKIKATYERLMSTLDNLSEISFLFCFNPNKGHRRHGARRCCDLPKYLGGNKSKTRLVFTPNN